VPMDEPRYDAARKTILPVFLCPADRETGVYTVLNERGNPLVDAATNSYAANFGTGGEIGELPEFGNGTFYRNSKIKLMREIPDGGSYTLAIGERASLFLRTPWAGAVSGGTVRTTAGAPVRTSYIEEAPVQVMARIDGWVPLNSPNSNAYCFFSPH